MTPIASALIPVFLVILIGWALRTSKLLPDAHWASIDHLTYYVLFPALIIKSLGTADLSDTPVIPIAATMMVAIITMSALLFFSRPPLQKLLGLTPAGYTSLFQGATRWNTFVALAIIAALYGDHGLATASIGIAIIIPLVNLFSVGLLSLHGDKPDGSPPHLFRKLLSNPLIGACAIGIVLNLSPLKLPEIAYTSLELIGRGALAISLMSVGAALRTLNLLTGLPPVAGTAVLRLIGMPVLMLSFGLLFGLKGDALVIAAICGGVPTASSAYLLARQMGGDAELMAAIITFQILAAILTLPILMGVSLSLAG
jgi:predicted permease